MSMRVRYDATKRVRKFILDDEEDRNKYERIINNSKYTIVKEEFTYDKMGRALITIWYEEEED